MMNKTDIPVKPPWKYPWFLFVVGLPALVVVACFVTLYLAIQSDDGVVSDDYYKEGLAINQSLKRDDKAKAYGLNAQLTLSSNLVELHLQGNDSAALSGQPLQLFLQNMGVPKQDQKVTLLPSEQVGVWYAKLPQIPPKGLWHVHVETSEWRLLTKIDGALDRQPIVLK